MKVLKEDLQNVDSVENLQPVEEIVMADAQQTSKKKWKEVKDIIDPKERAKEEPFTGSDGKQPEPKKAEVPKPQLDESLFEDVDEEEEEVDGWGSEVEAITADILSDIDQLAYEIRNCVRGSYTNCDNVNDLADYIEYLGITLSEVSDEVRDASIVESLKENIDESIKEAKEFDLWDRVYEELCPDHINIMKKTRFPDVTLGERYGQDDVIEVDNDDNIVVYGKDDAAFDFARKVCDSYGCEFDGPHKSAQYKVQKYGPKFALYAKVKIPY